MIIKKWNVVKTKEYLKGYREGYEDAKKYYADKDYLDFEDGKITMNEYRQRKGFSPIKDK